MRVWILYTTDNVCNNIFKTNKQCYRIQILQSAGCKQTCQPVKHTELTATKHFKHDMSDVN